MRSRLLLLSLVTLLLGGLVAVGAAARSLRPAPFGDAVANSAAAKGRGVVADALRIMPDGAVQAFDRRTGAGAWSYRRPGRTPLRLVPLTGGPHGMTVAVWDDGILTGLQPEPAAVRWHRYVPGITAKGPLLVVPLGTPAADGSTPSVPPAPAPPTGETFLVMTPQLVMTYNTGDGTIRTSTLPPAGCDYRMSGAAAPAQVADWVVARRDCADGTVSLEGYNFDGRRWGRPYGALAFGVRTASDPAGDTARDFVAGRRLTWALEVTALPWRKPFALDPATGRSAGECVCAAR